MIQITPTRDIAACIALRRAVFIDEQGVPEADEIDQLDDQAIHLLATRNGQPCGTARLVLLGPVGKIGRVCVLASVRGTGLGAALIRAALAELRRNPDLTHAKLGAQTHAIAFYERFGFVANGPIYEDGGIPHRDMTAPLWPQPHP